MTARIQADDALPRPSRVTPMGAPKVLSSSAPLPFPRFADPEVVPRSWRLDYVKVRPEVADALRAHFDAWSRTPFYFTIPRTAERVLCIYAQGPVTEWASAAEASTTLTLEEATQHE